MATVIPFNNPITSDGTAATRVVANIVQSYFDIRHLLDHLIALRDSGGGSNWTAIEAACGVAAGQGQAFFNAVNGTLAYMVSAHDAAAVIDQMRPA